MKRITLIVLIICVALTIASVVFTAYIGYKTKVVTNNEFYTLYFSSELQKSSDYLSRQARQYAITGDTQYYDNYWIEVKIDKTRDMAIEKMKQHGVSDEDLHLAQLAKNESDRLIETERLAMNAAQGGNLELAQSLLFGVKYEEEKIKITDYLTEFEALMLKKAERESGRLFTQLTVVSGITVFLSLLVIYYIYSSQRSIKDKAVLNEKCFRALAEQTNNVIFECDLVVKRITSLSNINLLFGKDTDEQEAPEGTLNSNMIFKEDRDSFNKIFKTIYSGDGVTDARFRIIDEDGKYHWCSLSCVVISSNDGMPYKAIGSIENIDEQVKREDDLRKKAERDSLTGLLNKATTEHLIKETLQRRRKNDSKHALMIIDIDYFKSVNDRLGHMYGDNVLTDLSMALKQIFRSDDIVGRVGGDEFFVFLKNYSSMDLIHAKATEICNAFKNTYNGEDISVDISASIGIVLCPEHGEDFDTLYKNADTALYKTKADGKNGYTIYCGASKKQGS